MCDKGKPCAACKTLAKLKKTGGFPEMGGSGDRYKKGTPMAKPPKKKG